MMRQNLALENSQEAYFCIFVFQFFVRKNYNIILQVNWICCTILVRYNSIFTRASCATFDLYHFSMTCSRPSLHSHISLQPSLVSYPAGSKVTFDCKPPSQVGSSVPLKFFGSTYAKCNGSNSQWVFEIPNHEPHCENGKSTRISKTVAL